jgi:hypothetical protein
LKGREGKEKLAITYVVFTGLIIRCE